MIENYRGSLDAAIKIGEEADRTATLRAIVIERLVDEVRRAIRHLEEGRPDVAIKVLRKALSEVKT